MVCFLHHIVTLCLGLHHDGIMLHLGAFGAKAYEEEQV